MYMNALDYCSVNNLKASQDVNNNALSAYHKCDVIVIVSKQVVTVYSSLFFA